MKKAAVVCVESTGHVNPQIALALGLAAQGVRVRFYIPSEKMMSHLDNLSDMFEVVLYHHEEGYTFDETHNKYDNMLNSYMISMLKSTVESMPAFLESVTNWNPDVIIYDPKACCACLSAIVLNIPCVATQTFPGFNFIHPMIGLNEEESDLFIEAQEKSALVANFNGILCGVYGHDVLRHSVLSHTVIPTGCMVCTGIKAFETELSPKARQLLRGMTNNAVYVGPMQNEYGRIAAVNTQAENSQDQDVEFPFSRILEMRKSGKKVIYVSFGTQVTGKGWNIDPSVWGEETFAYGIKHSGRAYCQTLWTRVIEAFGHREEYFVVLATVGQNIQAASEGEIPPNFFVCSLCPQIEVLEMADVFITHAGANSMCESINAAVPMLALPFAGDQYANAKVISREGLGLHYSDPVKEASVMALRTDVIRLLDNFMFHKKKCDRISKSLQSAGGVPKAVAKINEYVKDFKGHMPLVEQRSERSLLRSKSCGEYNLPETTDLHVEGF